MDGLRSDVHHQKGPSSAASPWHGHPKTRDRRKYDHYHQDLRKLARLQPVIFQMEMEQRVFSTWSNVNCAMPRTFQAGRWSYRAELSRKQKTESLQRTDGKISGWNMTQNSVLCEICWNESWHVTIVSMHASGPWLPSKPASSAFLATTGWINNTNEKSTICGCMPFPIEKNSDFMWFPILTVCQFLQSVSFVYLPCWENHGFLGCSPGAGWRGFAWYLQQALDEPLRWHVGSKIAAWASAIETGIGGYSVWIPRRISYG